MSKAILVDTSSLVFRAIFNWERQILNEEIDNSKILPAHYTYFIMLLSALKKIGVDRDDVIIMALEGKSWRKDYASYYKAQREEAREQHEAIDWDKQFSNLNKFHKQLEEATTWHFVRDWKAEADDVIAVACRYYKDQECIVASSDGDLKQLCYYPNVKFFSVCKKCKSSNGMYELVEKPLKILADKARKGDVSDNIIPQPNEVEEDIELREFLVNILELPEFIEKPIIEKLKNLKPKKENLDLLPFKNSKEKFLKIYDKNKVITYDYCKKLQEKRKVKKRKIAKAKLDAKKKGEKIK